MRYLTKEWYSLCQMTGLHFGMTSHSGASQKDEALYLRLRKRKEKAFIQAEREVYDFDPREIREIYEGGVFVSAEKLIAGEAIGAEDMLVHHMTDEEKSRVNERINEYDSRGPFDVAQCKLEFIKMQESIQSANINRLPPGLYAQIADPRVFALGYCTKEIRSQLKALSKENSKKVDTVLNEYTKARNKERIPEPLSADFGFHDCRVRRYIRGRDVVLYLDTEGGLTENNRIIFENAKVIKQEQAPEGSYWLYEELYRVKDGYEAHMLFFGADTHELTLCCSNIMIVKE